MERAQQAGEAVKSTMQSAAHVVQDAVDKGVQSTRQTGQAIAAGVGSAFLLAAAVVPFGEGAENTDQLRREYKQAKEEFRHEHDYRKGDLELDTLVASHRPTPAPTATHARGSDSPHTHHQPHATTPYPAPDDMPGGTPMPGDIGLPAAMGHAPERPEQGDNPLRYEVPETMLGGTPMPGDVGLPVVTSDMPDVGNKPNAQQKSEDASDVQRDRELHAPLQSAAAVPKLEPLQFKLGPTKDDVRHVLHLDRQHGKHRQQQGGTLVVDAPADSAWRAVPPPPEVCVQQSMSFVAERSKL